QLRSTVSQFGVTSEPVKQMLDYIWNTQILLPADCRGLSRLIFTPHQHSTSLQPATRGSLGLDLAAAVDVTLLTTRPTKIPTGVKGPLVIDGQSMGALLIGRSSASLLGLFVLPGVIDADYTGEIMIMAYTLFPPVSISKGQRLAQLVPLPQTTQSLAPASGKTRGEGEFGSTGGLTMLTLDLRDRPKKQVVLTFQGHQHVLQGLLDTGADSSIIAPHCWPANWPLQASTTTVTGVGGMTLASHS
ncbi:POK9 protein, partial [Mohoua ochrocephala]|nr:POK9 protein [Mohoua ochrocephala]